jgi:glycine/D-amino acid oxidase-like deaminating enzyme
LRIDSKRFDLAGVVGLSTAIKIQEHGGYHVTVIGETIPGDPKSIRYTSPWAVRFILWSFHVNDLDNQLAH